MLQYNKEKITLYYLPLLCEMTSLFNSVLAKVGLHRLYLLVYIVAFMSLLSLKSDPRKQPVISSYLYLGSLFFIMLFHLIIGTRGPTITIMATMTYILPVLYWITYCTRAANYIYDILYTLRYPFAIIAILGILQFFFSPTLWGLYVPDEGAMAWATNEGYESYKNYLRVGSILPSPQVFGLVFGLYTAVFLKFFMRLTFIDIVLLIIFFIAGLLSGTKSFFLIVGVYFLISLFGGKTKKSTKCLYLVVIFVAAFLIFYLQDYFEFLKRLTDTQMILEGEQEGRLSIYKSIIKDSIFLGNGPGISQTIGGLAPDYRCTESYLLMILFEMGYIPMLFFILVLIGGFIRSKQKLYFFLCVISMAYVHAFGSFVLFIFWPFVLIPNVIQYQNQK